MMSGDNDIKLLKNAFKRNGYNFWCHTLDSILEMRKIQNFVNEPRKARRNRTAPTNDPGWGGHFVIGNSKCNKRLHPSNNILHTFRLRTQVSSCLSVLNPITRPLFERNKVILSQFIDNNNVKFYEDTNFLFSQNTPNLTVKPDLNKLIDKGVSDIIRKSTNTYKKSVGHDQFLLKFLLNKSNKGAICSIYHHLVKCKFNTSEHHNMKRWRKDHHLYKRVNPSSNLIKIASANLGVAKTSAYSHKATQECILAAMRTEKHLIHFPTHPTGLIRNCPICDGKDSLIHAMVDCALPSYLWNIYSIMLTDIAMCIIPDDRFKILGVLKKSDIDQYSKTQVKVAYSLACLIRSILFSEYYKRNGSPNTSYILDRLSNELSILKDIGSFYFNWIHQSLSSTDILMLKIKVPSHPPYMRSVEQRVMDLLQDNDSNKSFFSHSNFDSKLRFMINQSWSHILDKTAVSQLIRPPESFDQIVLSNLNRDGFIDELKVDCLFCLSGIIPSNCL